MSVIVFTREEVAALNRHAQALASRLPDWSEDKANELACAFRALHIAQAATAAMTYREGFVIPEPFDWDGADDLDPDPNDDAYWPRPGPENGNTKCSDVLRQLHRLLGGLGHARYNTVSNGGTDFLPERYATVLDRLESELRGAMEHDLSTERPISIPTRTSMAGP
jgi:hypothetical protein